MPNMYRTLLRPVFGGGIPPGVKWELVEAPRDGTVNRPDLKVSRYRYGVFITDRPLTEDELRHFDIVPFVAPLSDDELADELTKLRADAIRLAGDMTASMRRKIDDAFDRVATLVIEAACL